MSPPDAQTYWISRKIPTDQFLLYCFDAPDRPLDAVRTELLARAGAVADLRLRVREVPFHADYPYWVAGEIDAGQVLLHGTAATWTRCRSAVEELLAARLDPCEMPWRLHLFGVEGGAPGGVGPAAVAVLQVSHALADGRGAADLARALFGPSHPESGPRPRPWWPAFAVAAAAVRLPWQLATLVAAAWPAHRTHRALEHDSATGLVPPPPPSHPKGLTNAKPDEDRLVRMVVCDAADLRGGGVTVTVGALTAISLALTRYLSERGSDGPLVAEVTVAKTGAAQSRNHFHNVAVDLHPELADPHERAAAIAASMDRARIRGGHPAAAAADRALRSVPGPLVRWGVQQFDFTAIPDAVTGNTVVSSVNRGPADLTLGGGAVRFTSGFPALSQFMGLTHGVHGIGGTVTIGVATSPAVLDDVDGYEQMLHQAVDEVRDALRRAGRTPTV
ncbi:WS/DGAT domain-containing protein [Rhodococcus kronopolitis]|uniref:WS/DGAT domain-containing protein n=1 Tax=Rhodococcus kronopolitis TaxID=1460226 RepID=A0ABV9FU90_9NOCA